MSVLTPYPTAHASMEKASGRRWIPYLIFALCAGLYLLPFMRLLLQGTDEGTLVDGAVRIVHGQVFARDFFEIVGPGTFYWLALFFKLFGVTFLATRICLFLTSTGSALLIYFLSRRVCRGYQVLPCILVFSVYFGPLWPAISHHTDSNFFALLAFTSIVLWQDSRKNSLLLAAGALAGATTCFLQPKGILLLLAFVVWLWIQHRRGSVSLSSLGLVAGGYFSVVGLMLLYFWSQGALSDLIYANAVWPSRHYETFNIVPYACYIRLYYWNRWVNLAYGVKWAVVMAVVLIIPFLFVAALPVLLLFLGIRNRARNFKPEILLYWLCGGALWFSELHRKDIFHLAFGSPLLIILCIHFLAEYRSKVADLALQVLSLSAACLAGFNLFMVLAAHPVKTRVGTVAMFRDDLVVRFLDENVPRGEEIFAYPLCPMDYFLSATINPTPYSRLIYNYHTPSQFQQVIRILDQHKVRYVVWDTNFEAKVVGLLFPLSTRMPPKNFILEPYLESHYKLIWEKNGIRIMERKGEVHADR